MALVTIPASEDLCALLAALQAGDIVIATSEDDFCPPDLCDLGAQIVAEDENDNADYKMVVIDPDDNCLKWMSLPDAPVYDSTLIQPLILTKEATYSIIGAGSLRSNVCKLDLVTANFPVASKLIVTWTALAKDPNAGGQSLRWKPRGVVGGANADMITGYIQSADIPSLPNWASGEYSAVLDIPANPVGLYLSFDFIDYNGGANPVKLKIDAVAFKA